MTNLPTSIDDTQTLLSRSGYVCGRALATNFTLVPEPGEEYR